MPRKLSEADRQEILELYSNTDESLSTLASRYGVSSSTISRVLKMKLSNLEYDTLIEYKRQLRLPNRESFSPEDIFEAQAPGSDESADELFSDDFADEPTQDIPPLPETKVVQTQLNRAKTGELQEYQNQSQDEPQVEQLNLFDSKSILTQEFGLDEEYLEELDEEEFDDEEEENFKAQNPIPSQVQVLPLSQALFPKTCYIVIDRASELIARPLKEFADLGNIPVSEVQQKTLPVFDNQRVARRFSNRSQRIIKVPDGRLLQKASSNLQAKGITRLLIDGQVYSL